LKRALTVATLALLITTSARAEEVSWHTPRVGDAVEYSYHIDGAARSSLFRLEVVRITSATIWVRMGLRDGDRAPFANTPWATDVLAPFRRPERSAKTPPPVTDVEVATVASRTFNCRVTDDKLGPYDTPVKCWTAQEESPAYLANGIVRLRGQSSAGFGAFTIELCRLERGARDDDAPLPDLPHDYELGGHFLKLVEDQDSSEVRRVSYDAAVGLVHVRTELFESSEGEGEKITAMGKTWRRKEEVGVSSGTLLGELYNAGESIVFSIFENVAKDAKVQDEPLGIAGGLVKVRKLIRVSEEPGIGKVQLEGTFAVDPLAAELKGCPWHERLNPLVETRITLEGATRETLLGWGPR
jgi:hypothetical protein